MEVRESSGDNPGIPGIWGVFLSSSLPLIIAKKRGSCVIWSWVRKVPEQDLEWPGWAWLAGLRSSEYIRKSLGKLAFREEGLHLFPWLHVKDQEVPGGAEVKGPLDGTSSLAQALRVHQRRPQLKAFVQIKKKKKKAFVQIRPKKKKNHLSECCWHIFKKLSGD